MSGHGTKMALAALVVADPYRGRVIQLPLLDISLAFNCTDHSILLCYLQGLPVGGIILLMHMGKKDGAVGHSNRMCLQVQSNICMMPCVSMYVI